VNPWTAVGILWAGAALAMAAGWWWQVGRENAGIVDVIWTAGIGAAAVWYAAVLDGAPLPRVLLGALGGLWSLRLAAHLAPRVLRGPEDGRYRQLRQHWRGSQAKMFGMFQLQALLVVLCSVPFLGVGRNPRTILSPWMLLGVVVWLVSVAGEWVADHQLARFRDEPSNQGRTCRQGLWHYSRHPNYFFEWLHWFAYVGLAVGSPLFCLSLPGPVVMYGFLRWISGIPFTEAQALRTRGEDYRRYQAETPLLFPRLPKEKVR
jgi:steroid 5-alpha reductase family enzyme